jgi:hypothetical protein
MIAANEKGWCYHSNDGNMGDVRIELMLDAFIGANCALWCIINDDGKAYLHSSPLEMHD